MTQAEPTSLESVLSGRVGLVMELRSGAPMPALSDGPSVIAEALVEVRSRLDRVEEQLSQLLRLRAAARRRARSAKDEVEDAWAERVAGNGSARRSRGNTAMWSAGDTAPRERYAEADLAVLDQRRAERRYGEQSAHAEEAVEVVQLAHRGLSDLRRDIHVMLRAFEMENSLER